MRAALVLALSLVNITNIHINSFQSFFFASPYNTVWTRLLSPPPPVVHKIRMGFKKSKLHYSQISGTFSGPNKYSHAPHNDVSVNDGPHIRRWSHRIIILYYNT